MSLIPTLFGNENLFQPTWDPPSRSNNDTSSFTNAQIDWKNDMWHRVERRSGKFTRRFQMPQNANLDAVNATIENGVLTITVPKEEKRPEVNAIKISG
ncbi:hypothetical protein AQUCO_06500023v1 [Aquilegia coerulea]|uniref:SHSP domain-containing protein n=1 Tax=Aquilegia coerulea TaxID=218851 RepID=A0A2G5CC86_AQUCA|nr:hypothetical protein AQUCO_06500023v1 [Aquilegia coerulea]